MIVSFKSKIAILICSILCFGTLVSKAQLTVSTALTPAQLVQNVLLGGGVTASNITYNGVAVAAGSFNGATSNIGFSSGIILATGDVNVAVGPNNSGSLSNGGAGTSSTDPELTSIATNTLYDAAILEFDFIPISDTVKFRYVFGSEEYPEYVCSNYNDVFGFFISGPNPAGGTYTNNNIAIIPTSNPPLAVAINSVNPGVAGSSSGGGTCTSLAYSSFYFDNETPPGTSVQYDGFTVPLTAIAAVTCGQTYHIKIAIADVGDAAFDSGVFLEAGSFSSVGVTIIPEISYGGSNDSTLYEGCGTACIYFIRTSNLTQADTINVTVGGSAVNGVDYNTGTLGTPIPTQLFFTAGQDSISYCINAVSDGITEGLDTITLTIVQTGPCSSLTTSATIYLNEYSQMVLTTSDTTLCNTLGPLTLLATVSGGVEPYTYSWTNGAASVANPTVNQTTDITYVVTVDDACTGSSDPTPSVTDSTRVTIISIPAITSVINSGGINGSTLYEGCGQACFYFVRTINIAVADTFTLNVAGTASAGVDYTTTLPTQLFFAAGQDSLIYCVSITADALGETNETITLSINVPGVCNLSSNDSLTIVDLLPLTLSVSNDTTLCNVLPGPLTLLANVSGGVQPYTYAWTNGASSVANPTVIPTFNATYIVTVTDACTGSPDPTPSVTDSTKVIIISIPSITSVINSGAINSSTFYEGCGQACFYFVRTINIAVAETFTLNVAGTATNGVDYTTLPTQLSFAAGQDSLTYCISTTTDALVETTETIDLSINITGACNLTTNDMLTIVNPLPLTLSVSNDTVLQCQTSPVAMFANVSGGVAPYTYSWTNGAGNISNPTVTPPSTTTYVVTVSDNCSGSPDPTPAISDSVKITVVIYNPLLLNAGNDINVCPGDVLNLFAAVNGGGTPYIYNWTTFTGTDTLSSSNTAATSVIANSTGIFQVTVMDICGTIQNDQVIVTVEPSCEISIPNVITPDGSGPITNEFFYVENLDKFPNSNLEVYNRWGKKVYESPGYLNNWNGGKLVDGTYYYVLTVPASGQVLPTLKPTTIYDIKINSETDKRTFAGYFQIIRTK